MASRRHNPRLAKSLRSYTIADVATLYGVHRNTVRNWLADGLKAIDDKRPILINGGELNRHHAAKRASAKGHCGPGEIYCLACRAPRVPAGRMADYLPGLGGVGTVSAICPDCENVMTQRVNARRLSDLRAVVEVEFRPAPEPIEEGP